MSYRYTDEKIPSRVHGDGSFRRPSSAASRVSSRRAQYAPDSGSGRWQMVSEKELFTGYSTRRKDLTEREDKSSQETDLFSRLLRMTGNYHISDGERCRAFLEQARMMEAYGEEGEIADIDRYHAYIGYQEMDAWELHQYFCWRTRFRRGEDVPLHTGYMLLHAAELINLVGAGSMQEAFDRLLRLMQAGQHPGRQASIPSEGKRRLDRILCDFVITWGPGEEIVQAYCIADLRREVEDVTLLHYPESDDASLYRAIWYLSDRRNLRSAFLKEQGEDGRRLIARVFRRVCLAQKQAKTPVLAERLLGERTSRPRPLFSYIPYETRAEDGYQVEISPVTSWCYKDGMWYRSSYPVMREEDAVRDLNALVRECERVLRKKTHYRNQLPDRMKNPVLEKLIGEEYERWMREKAVRNRPEVRVDLSKLGMIRDLAAVTRERLLEGTEEGAQPEDAGEILNRAVADEEEEAPGGRGLSEAPRAPADSFRSEDTKAAEDTPEDSAAEAGTDSGASGLFNSRERAFLQLLLEGGNGAGYFRDHRILPSVFVDAINEKAFDEIGDSIVEEDGSGWRLVEDYIEDVRLLLREER